jgi:hypothetical protein
MFNRNSKVGNKEKGIKTYRKCKNTRIWQNSKGFPRVKAFTYFRYPCHKRNLRTVMNAGEDLGEKRRHNSHCLKPQFIFFP